MTVILKLIPLYYKTIAEFHQFRLSIFLKYTISTSLSIFNLSVIKITPTIDRCHQNLVVFFSNLIAIHNISTTSSENIAIGTTLYCMTVLLRWCKFLVSFDRNQPTITSNTTFKTPLPETTSVTRRKDMVTTPEESTTSCFQMVDVKL